MLLLSLQVWQLDLVDQMDCGELLKGFFDFYAHDFEWARAPGPNLKTNLHWNLLWRIYCKGCVSFVWIAIKKLFCKLLWSHLWVAKRRRTTIPNMKKRPSPNKEVVSAALLHLEMMMAVTEPEKKWKKYGLVTRIVQKYIYIYTYTYIYIK